MLDLNAAAEEIRRLSGLIDDGITALRRFARETADAEATYRKSKAQAWVNTPREDEDGKSVIAKEREAMVDADTADERRNRDIADSMKQAALEAVRSRRAQLSALQSLLAAEREEAAFSRTGTRLEP